MFRRLLIRLKHDNRGAAMVEMAMLLPFLMLIGCGVFEFGAFFYQYQKVQAGVRDAARYLARVTDTDSLLCNGGTAKCLTPCAAEVLATKVTNAKDIAVMGQIGGTTKRVSWWSESDVTVDYSVNIANPYISGYPSYRGPASGIRIVTVSSSPAYPGVGFLGFLGVSPAITLSHSERCIGQG